jgi:hypothetical protein
MVLGKPLGLLLRPLLRQAGHLITILEDIPTKALPQGLLLVDWHNRRLLLLDNLQCNLLLHAHQLLLDPERRSDRGGQVFGPSRRMVCTS